MKKFRIIEIKKEGFRSKFQIEKELTFLFIFKYWKKEYELKESFYGIFEIEKEFYTKKGAEEYISETYKMYSIEYEDNSYSLLTKTEV